MLKFALQKKSNNHLRKGSKIRSILNGSCPRCQEESMYRFSNPYNLLQILVMNKSCSNCKLQYQIEPSFFFGSMYVSYGVGIIFSIVTFLIARFIFDLGMMGCFLSIIAVIIGFLPIIARLSRNIWINGFIHFDKKFSKKQ